MARDRISRIRSQLGKADLAAYDAMLADPDHHTLAELVAWLGQRGVHTSVSSVHRDRQAGLDHRTYMTHVDVALERKASQLCADLASLARDRLPLGLVEPFTAAITDTIGQVFGLPNFRRKGPRHAASK